jgi:hypothetical protein
VLARIGDRKRAGLIAAVPGEQQGTGNDAVAVLDVVEERSDETTGNKQRYVAPLRSPGDYVRVARRRRRSGVGLPLYRGSAARKILSAAPRCVHTGNHATMRNKR